MILYRILIIFVLLFSNIDIPLMNNTNLLKIMTTANELIIYNNGSYKDIDLDSKQHEKITQELIALSTESRESPAFGVSLHDETLSALESGVWIEFIFNETITHNDLPFDALLINVVGDFTGFNIVRKYNNKYEGRCFYIDLINGNLSSLENIILDIF